MSFLNVTDERVNEVFSEFDQSEDIEKRRTEIPDMDLRGGTEE